MAWKRFEDRFVFDIISSAVNVAVFKTASDILTQAKQEVPLGESPLMNSGIVIERSTKKKQRFVVSFGGGRGTGKRRLPYALKWHEKQARHFQHGRKRFYLLDPMNHIGTLRLNQYLSEEVRKVLNI